MQGRVEASKIVAQSEPALSGFLSKCPFASTGIIAAHFGVARDSVKTIPAREFGHGKV
jgi:hypothetical protein